MHVVVLVLGDVGRSPRMQYHAMSLSKLKCIDNVTLLGYTGEACIDTVRQDKRIRCETFSPLILPQLPFPKRWTFCLLAPIKVIWQVNRLISR